MFDNLTFDAATYANDKRLAGNAWRNADGKGDSFARSAMVALATSSLSPLAIAISVYDEMKPETAKGKLAEPKESEKAPCGVSVSSLRSAVGGEGAKKALETIFYIWEHRSFDVDSVAAFIRGDRSAFKLFPLKAHLQKLRADAAKAEAEATGESDVEREGDAEPTAESNPIVGMAECIAAMTGEELSANADAIALLLDVCRDASDKLAAADSVRKAA